MEEFNEFYQNNLNKRPYDFIDNGVGFPTLECGGVSDISAHLPLLTYLASLPEVNVITEFGVRDGNSTSAWIKGCRGTVHGYDQTKSKEVDQLIEWDSQGKLPCKFVFHNHSTLMGEIDWTDILFLDTLHTDQQVKEELKLHGHKCLHYLVFHDTTSQWKNSLDRPEHRGIGGPIIDYTRRGWNLVYEAKFNHGLMVFKRDN